MTLILFDKKRKSTYGCPHKCECLCHKPPFTTKHFMNCCDGICKECKAHIKRNQMGHHLLQCHGKEAEKETEL